MEHLSKHVDRPPKRVRLELNSKMAAIVDEFLGLHTYDHKRLKKVSLSVCLFVCFLTQKSGRKAVFLRVLVKLIRNLRYMASHPCRLVFSLDEQINFELDTRHDCTVDLSITYKKTKQYIISSPFSSLWVKIDS